MPAAAKGKVDRQKLILVGAGGLILVVLFLLYTHRAQAQPLVSSGTPGPDLSGSAAQQPNGGASSIPDQLPSTLVSTPDQLTQQVQQTDTTSGESPQQILNQGNPLPGYVPQPGSVSSIVGTGGVGEVPGSSSHPGTPGASPLLVSSGPSNAHRPGVQIG